jgi:hypothetical protein
MRLVKAFFLSALTLFVGCGRQPAQHSNLKMEVQVPGNQVNSQGVAQLIAKLGTIQSAGSGVLSLAELLAVIPFTSSEFADLNQARDATATVTCANSICTGSNSGSGQEMNVSQMNLPSLGVPHISIADDIELKFRLGNAQVLDVCSIIGFSVKKFFIWSPMLAARINLNQNGQAIDGSIIASPSTISRCN